LLNKGSLKKINPEELYPEIQKCYYLAIGDYEKYWKLRKNLPRTIVNVVSSLGIEEYRKGIYISNKKLLITTSEGFGDNIMSLRYLEEFLNKNDVKVTLLVLKELKPLFEKLLKKYNLEILEYLNEKDHKKIDVDYYSYLTELAAELDINSKDDIKRLGEKYTYPDVSGGSKKFFFRRVFIKDKFK
jgi:hypothetical protein